MEALSVAEEMLRPSLPRLNIRPSYTCKIHFVYILQEPNKALDGYLPAILGGEESYFVVCVYVVHPLNTWENEGV